jgi:hypothetical protein
MASRVALRSQVDHFRVRDRRALAATCAVWRMWLVNRQEAGPLGGWCSVADSSGDRLSWQTPGALSPDRRTCCDPWPPAAPLGPTHHWGSLV